MQIMNALIPTVNPVTMSSLELVDYINSQRGDGEATLAHSDFLKKVPQVLGDGAGNFSFTYRAGRTTRQARKNPHRAGFGGADCTLFGAG